MFNCDFHCLSVPAVPIVFTSYLCFANKINQSINSVGNPTAFKRALCVSNRIVVSTHAHTQTFRLLFENHSFYWHSTTHVIITDEDFVTVIFRHEQRDRNTGSELESDAQNSGSAHLQWTQGLWQVTSLCLSVCLSFSLSVPWSMFALHLVNSITGERLLRLFPKHSVNVFRR